MNVKNAKRREPLILLYGSFDDWFLEGVMTLGYNYKISNLSNLKNIKGKFDIVVFGWDSKIKVEDVLKEVKAVPVLMKNVKGFVDYNAQTEKGSCFKYKKNTSFHQLEALIKACEAFKYPYDWKNVKRAATDTVKYRSLA